MRDTGFSVIIVHAWKTATAGLAKKTAGSGRRTVSAWMKQPNVARSFNPDLR